MSVTIRKLSRGDSDFYQLLGPYFGSRSVAREVGINIYDDKDKEWFAAFKGETLAGFASIRGKIISDCYVIDCHRRKGMFLLILSSVLTGEQLDFAATCTDASLGAFLSHGFKIKSKTKNFTKVEFTCQRKG